MILSRPNRIVGVVILVVFNLFLVKDTVLARQPPEQIVLTVKLDVGVRWAREGNRMVPRQLLIGDDAFPIVQGNGRHGVRIQLRKLTAASPELEEKLHLVVAQTAVERIRELVGNDEEQAQLVADHFAAVASGKGSTTVSQSGRFSTGAMSNAYNQVLNGAAFVFPQKPLPFAAEDAEEEAGGGGEGDDDEGGWLTWLAGVIFAIVVIIAPIVATVWLATQALTLAAVLTAFLGSIGAVSAAGHVAATLATVDYVLSGEPLIDIEGYG